MTSPFAAWVPAVEVAGALRSRPGLRDDFDGGGGGPKVVMETLGHSQVNLTLGTYSHVSAELQGTAATTMDAVLRST